MILSIRRTPSFNKRLETLRKAGGKPAVAAGSAEAIIDDLVNKGLDSLEKIGRITKHGERRIKNCIKFDLFDSYRLICARKGNTIIFLYIGSHDEADRWLERKKGLQIDISAKASEIETVYPKRQKQKTHEAEPAPEDDYDDLLLAKIDDKILSSIFSGLCGKQ